MQLTKYIETNGLFANLQSGYRKIARIRYYLLCIIDDKTNALLLLFDLSAAFDTVNHQLLLINKLRQS